MIKVSLFFVFLNLFCGLLIAQDKFKTDSETHIFWQPDRRLTLKDFQGNPTQESIDICKTKGACVTPCIGLFLRVDIPKKYRKNKLEKVYFAPAFQKSCSSVVSDTNDIRDGQFVFDICEISARIARKLLRDWHDYMAIETDSMNFYIIKVNPDTILITGIGTSLAWKAKDSALNFYNSMRESYVHDLYYSTQGESYDTWRALADELLEKLSLYATKPEECNRMIQNKPIESEYKPADK